jgi:hypothetical protein
MQMKETLLPLLAFFFFSVLALYCPQKFLMLNTNLI